MSSQALPRSQGNSWDDEESRPLLDLPIDVRRLGSSGHGRGVAGVATRTLAAAALERAAFYSLQANIVYYLLHTSSLSLGEASSAGAYFLSMTYCLCLLVGLMSDLFVPPYWAINASYLPYVAGYAFLAWTGYCNSHRAPKSDGTCDLQWCPDDANRNNTRARYLENSTTGSPNENDGPWKLYLALAGVVLGASIQRTLVAPFGADQVQSQGLSATRSYFWQYYWALNAGSLVSIVGVSLLQMQCQYGTGLLVPLGLLLLSWLVFVSGWRRYRRRSPNRSAIKYFLTIVLSGFRLWRNRPRGGSGLGILDYAKVVNGGSHSIVAVENVKATTRTAIVLALMLPYFILYSKTMSAFGDEGPHMATPGGKSIKVPFSLLMAFNNVGLLATIPLCNLVIYPLLSRWGVRLTMNKRITLGFFVITLCLVTAGGVEIARLDAGQMPDPWIDDYGRANYSNVSNMNVFYQVPQYALLGASETFTFVSVIELTYVLAPSCLESTMMGILWFTVGLSQIISVSFVALPYDSTQYKWAPTEFYFAAAGVAGCLTVAFGVCGIRCDVGLDTLTVPEPPRPSTQQSAGLPDSSSHLTTSTSQPYGLIQQ